MTEILLVRHGQSEWNAVGKWQGQADPPLSPLGRQQATAAGRLLSDRQPFDGIACSTLDRARTTARLIAAELKMDMPFESKHLIERSAGEWSGLTRAEIDRDYPGYLKSGRYPTGYEYDEEFIVRIRAGIDEVIANVPGDRLLIVAHGGLNYCLEASFGLPFKHMSNVGGRWLTRADNGTLSLGGRTDLLANFDGETTTPSAI